MVDSQSVSLPLILSSCSSGSSSSCDSKSPEFEFWMVRNQINLPQPNLLSADELFSDGFILPLRLLELSNHPPAQTQAAVTEDSEETVSDRDLEPELSTVDELPATSPGWRNIFHKSRGKKRLDSPGGDGGGDISTKENIFVGVVKERTRDKRKVNGGSVAAAELNINIWPFSRSRSAGNGENRPRSVANRKVSSAPCSRSNSTGESKLRIWPPNTPGRGGGLHVGRTSPVWQIRRGSGGRRGVDRMAEACPSGEKRAEVDGNEILRKVQVSPCKGRGGSSSRGRVLSFSVPMCVGYRHNLSCKGDENNAAIVTSAASSGGQGDDPVAGDYVRRSHLFNIKSLFSKKAY